MRADAAEVMRRRSHVLEALRVAGADGVSGEKLAASLGVSRVAVSKHIAALRDMGYRIDSAPRNGYLLLGAPDLPLPFEVAPLLSHDNIVLLGGGVTGSTNEDAKAAALEGAESGAVVLAAKQTAGKGRLGRNWESPEGGLYLSFVFRPSCLPVAVSSLGLICGLGVLDAFSDMGFVDASLKWPNDVYAPQGKLAGILLEMAASVEAVEYVVAGIGINVNRGAGCPKTAACLNEIHPAGNPLLLASVAASVIDGVLDSYNAWQAAGCVFSPFREAYEKHLKLLGKEVCVSRLDGTVEAEGKVDGVDDEGRLIVGGMPVVAGDVTLRRD